MRRLGWRHGAPDCRRRCAAGRRRRRPRHGWACPLGVAVAGDGDGRNQGRRPDGRRCCVAASCRPDRGRQHPRPRTGPEPGHLGVSAGPAPSGRRPARWHRGRGPGRRGASGPRRGGRARLHAAQRPSGPPGQAPARRRRHGLRSPPQRHRRRRRARAEERQRRRPAWGVRRSGDQRVARAGGP